MASIEEKITNLILPKVEELGYQLYDVEYAKEGKDYFLRIFIDSDKGIDLNDCEKVNNSINDILDTADYIKEQYFLEVSSPGVERILRKDKHLQQNIGNIVTVNLFKSIDGKKQFEGILNKYDEKNVYLQQEKDIIEIERKNISLIIFWRKE